MFGLFFFFFNDTATTEIYTLSLHDALPICPGEPFTLGRVDIGQQHHIAFVMHPLDRAFEPVDRSEEHTSELQSQSNLVCRLLLEKKKKTIQLTYPHYISHNIVHITHLSSTH